MTRKGDHVVMRENRFVCLRCHETYAPTLPCPIGIFTACAAAFAKAHRNCVDSSKDLGSVRDLRMEGV